MLIKDKPDTIKSYFEDSSNLRGGYAEKVILPDSAEEVSAALKEADAKKIPVTVSGGGTGTAGSRIPFGGIVISTERLNSILDVSAANVSAVVQAGVLVEDLKNACEKEGLFYTSHPTEKTAFVGGTVSTNASGSRSFKYGPTRRYVKGLKMVLSDGKIVSLRRGERVLARGNSRIDLGGLHIDVPMPSYKMPDVKNSAGYFIKDGVDLVDLFIGQEGTLSVITEVEIALVKKPIEIFSSFLFFRREEDAWGFSEEVRKRAFDVLSLEYFDSNALELLKAKNKNVPRGAKAAIFFEEDTHGQKKDSSFNKWLEPISRYNASLDDSWVAMNENEADRFTKFRHDIPEAVNDMIRASGLQKLSTDIAVPDDNFAEMMNFYVDALRNSGLEHIIFGHIGESHVHVNIIPRSDKEIPKARAIAFDFVKKGVWLGGTVSAEHGIGKIKHQYLEVMYGRQGILEMARLKKAFDPNCILGLDNIFPRDIIK